jgi:hypothetical protein
LQSCSLASNGELPRHRRNKRTDSLVPPTPLFRRRPICTEECKVQCI